MRLVYAGGPCTCAPGRYVRFVVPPVPGCTPAIHCRDNAAANEGKATHDIPPDAVLAIRTPNIGART